MRRLTVRRLCVALALVSCSAGAVACFALQAITDQTAQKQVIEIAVTDGKAHSESAERSGEPHYEISEKTTKYLSFERV